MFLQVKLTPIGFNSSKITLKIVNSNHCKQINTKLLQNYDFTKTDLQK